MKTTHRDTARATPDNKKNKCANKERETHTRTRHTI